MGDPGIFWKGKEYEGVKKKKIEYEGVRGFYGPDLEVADII